VVKKAIKFTGFGFFLAALVLFALNIFATKTNATTEINKDEILDNHFDMDIPGFKICQELRRLTEDLIDPSVTPPYEVFNFGVNENTDDSEGALDGSDTDSVTTQDGSVFQKWFLDACIMDGYITEVRHVATIHNFDVTDSIFSDENAIKELNLGELFEEAFMQVTKEGVLDDKSGLSDQDQKNLQEASLKDFFLSLKDSNEQFMTDLMTAISEKQRIDLEELQKYELAKIEKAREDVNKLTYEVYRELVDESLIYQDTLQGELVRGLGLKEIIPQGETADSCPFGVLIPNTSDGAQCMIIKKEGRVISNVDNFINEESLQKARDFLMCYLAPWRHFPVGEDYYFAASAAERTAIKNKNNQKFRDNTDPDFKYIDEAMRTANSGVPFCGTQAVAEIIRTDPDIKKPFILANYPTSTYPLFKQELYDGSKNICQVAEENGSEPNLARLCREAIRKVMDNKSGSGDDRSCDTQNICEKTRIKLDDPNTGFPYDYINASGQTETAKGRPDIFDTDFEGYVKYLCPSDQMKERLKKDLLLEMARKYQFIYDAPPEHWYYTSGTGDDKTRCGLILGNLGYDVEGIIGEISSDKLSSQTLLSYQKYQEKVWKSDLKIALAYRPDNDDTDYATYSGNPYKNSFDGVTSFLSSAMDKIKNDYKSSRTAEYLAGEGLRSDKYLVGFSDYQTNKYFFINTENIISPALFLKDKVMAATQAQFDLAQMAFKQQPEGSGETTIWTCPTPYVTGDDLKKDDFPTAGPYNSLKGICADQNKGLKSGWYLIDLTPDESDPSKKNYDCRWPQFNNITCEVFGYTTTQAIKEYKMPNELPAPWEDASEYMKIPDEYKKWFEGDITVQAGTSSNGTPIKVTKTGEELGLTKSPPAFDIAEYGKDPYDNWSEQYPEIYGKAYGNDYMAPATSSDYYINKWYKGITQLYEKPMSEILRTWFRQEATTTPTGP
jgi:hypothetical protein